MSSGETTLSGNSRFKSSNVRYFLSPPSSSRRSMTSSRSLSSIITVLPGAQASRLHRSFFALRAHCRRDACGPRVQVLLLFSCGFPGRLQHKLPLGRELDLLGGEPRNPFVIFFAFGDGQFPSQLLDTLLDPHQPESGDAFAGNVVLV